MKILHLTIYRYWFDAIVSGEKKFEYREITPFWWKKLLNKNYDEIHIRNGYTKNCPFVRIKYDGWEYQDFNGKKCFALRINKILEIKYNNYIQTRLSLCRQ